MKQSKNKLRTPGYFIKRLRDNGYVVIRVFSVFGKHDPRRWTVLINPTGNSVFCTCYINKNELGEVLFELDDGGVKIPKSFYLKTESIEVVVDFLMKNGISNGDYNGKSRYFVPRLNNNINEKTTQEV
ncbi:MAG: hypothetical protein EBU90_06740 [Proteobacteria bacterium]|nr:hypothetical protein [Pseudomonadota bacterium]NBP15005.1 hypothetical protein [bacterium]